MLLILLIALSLAPAAAEIGKHPLDPLTSQEYTAAIRTLLRENYVDDSSRYPLITLDELEKAQVLDWKTGDPIPRRAFVMVKNTRETYEAVVDIVEKKVLSWRQIQGVEPGILLTEEWQWVQQWVRRDPDWQAAMHRRGLHNFKKIVCMPHTVGYYGTPAEKDRRLVKVSCFDSRGVRNFWSRPIEGVIVTIDFHEGKVIQVQDIGRSPIPDQHADLDAFSIAKPRTPPPKISLEQPQGPGFRIDGQRVDWQKWRFRFRIDPRLGLVLSLVRYQDNGNERSILYQGSLSELFVPYMDPDPGWYFRTYMDAGEYGIGKLAVSLQPGLDCPSNGVFFDTFFADDWGDPYPRQRVACLFERYAGGLAWRHYEAVTGIDHVRRRTDLVLRSITAIGSYDYLFDWVFRQDGTLMVEVGATGIPQVKAVKNRTATDDPQGKDTAYGHRVAEYTVGVNHDHFFSFRLDLDVDGQANSLLRENLKTLHMELSAPRRSVWVVDKKVAATEQEAKFRIDLDKPALWRVINPNRINAFGHPVSYHLRPKANAVSLLSSGAFPQQRAGFTAFHLWTTPYRIEEKYAAGTYPNQSKGGDGLPKWTKANRPVENTDIVIWYTLGFHHVVRTEDWQVMPTIWGGFELKPFDFFQRNPALDLPEE